MNLAARWIGMDPIRHPYFRNTKISCFDRSVAPEPAMAVFRKVFDLRWPGSGLTAFFTGDCKFRLFINGRFVEDGPVEVGGDYANTTAPDWWFYDRRNISEYCCAGRNVIVAEVFNTGDSQTDYSTGRTAFALELADRFRTRLYSDGSWKCFRNPAYRGPGDFDASLDCGDYHSAAFDDSAWESAVELSAEESRRWNLKELKLPPLSEEPVLPCEFIVPFRASASSIENHVPLHPKDENVLTVHPGTPAHFYLRFDGELVGHTEIDVESAGGAEIRIEYQEVPGVTVAQDRYITAPGRREFRFTRLQPVHWVKVTVSCGRFASPTYGPVKIRRFEIQRRFFPLSGTTSFLCSDSGLMRLRDTIDWTMQLCMMRMHWDSPVHQEGLGCTGDYMIEALISYALYGETRLAAADILRTAYLLRQKDGFLFHTSYTLLYFDMVRDYYRWTGDRALLKTVFPVIRTVLERFAGYVGKTGLVSNAPNYMFIDWICDGDANYHHPPAERGIGGLTAFYCHALEVAAELAEELKIPNDWRERARRTGEAFREQLWDPRTRCFVDGIPHLGTGGVAPWCPPDRGETARSVHTNALALAYGLVPEAEAAALVETIMTDRSLLQPQPYFMHFVFEALHRTGTFGRYGFELMKRWIPLIEEYSVGLKECWNCGDYSHAWGGTPAYQLSRSVLGVTPISPGFRKVRIAPEFGPLTFAEGEVPTPCGMIRLKYDGMVCRCEVPRGIAVEIGGRHEIQIKKY